MSERFELPPELNIYSVMDIRDALLAWATAQVGSAREYLEVSARDVESVDGAGLQLLAALSHMERPWQLVETSDVFVDACHTLGLSQWLHRCRPSSTAGGAAP